MNMKSLATNQNSTSSQSGALAWARLLMVAGTLVCLALSNCSNARADTLAVSSMTDNKIYYVSTTGSVSPLAPINYYPEGVTFGPGTTAIHVVNWGGNLANRVSSGGAVSTFVTNIVDPYSLAFDSQTNLFVACYQINRVKKITSTKLVTDFATVPGAYGLALDAADNVFVAGLGNRLSRITRDGSSSLFGPPNPKKGERLVVLHTLPDDRVPEVLKQLPQLGLPNLWLPRANQFFHVDQLPRLASGKMDLRPIREPAVRFVAELERENKEAA